MQTDGTAPLAQLETGHTIFKGNLPDQLSRLSSLPVTSEGYDILAVVLMSEEARLVFQNLNLRHITASSKEDVLASDVSSLLHRPLIRYSSLMGFADHEPRHGPLAGQLKSHKKG